MRAPGLLRPSVNPDVIMMACTAGHVDHGKTSLVRLLTGCNTDRLKEEQERGMTIELGFAPCFLGGNLCVGIVDVPGHERFVRNMVAGVSGIDLAILVIAADDGIMPQTIEHFQIMDLLGVRHGIVALTKIDIVSEERVQEVTDSIAEFLAGTFMDSAPICPVSSETGQGFDAFYETLVSTIIGLARGRTHGIFRMPIERVFVQHGFGTVVTGIPVGGTVEIGANVELVPGGQRSKIRGIQRFLREANEGGYGQCLALNVSDLGKVVPRRGQVLCTPGYVHAARCFNVRVHAVANLDPALRHAEAIKFHTGTSEESGRIYLLDDGPIRPGAVGNATIMLDKPVADLVRDRFILRRPSPAITVAGGDIVEVVSGSERPRRKDAADSVQAYLNFFDGENIASPEGTRKVTEYALLSKHPAGAELRAIAVSAALPEADVVQQLDQLVQSGIAMRFQDGFFIHRENYAARLKEVQEQLKGQGQRLSMTLGELRKGFSSWPTPLWARIQDELQQDDVIAVRGSKVVLSSAVNQLNAVDRHLMECILAVYEDMGFHAPRPEETPDLLASSRQLRADPATIERLLNLLCNERRLVRLSKNVVLSYTAYRKAQDIAVQIIEEKGVLDSADFKYHIDSTRKYALGILDFLDARRITVRSGNDRKLTRDYKKNLL